MSQEIYLNCFIRCITNYLLSTILDIHKISNMLKDISLQLNFRYPKDLFLNKFKKKAEIEVY